MSERERSPIESFLFSGQDAYDALSATLADAVFVIDEGGDVVYVDPSLIDVLGVGPEAVVGRPILDLVHPDDAVRGEEGGFWNAALPFEREFRMRSAAGEWVWVRAVSATTDRDGGRPETLDRVLGSHRILLVRDRSREEMARDADDLVHEAFDAVNNLVVVTDMRAADNPLVVVNQNFVDTTGYERDEIIGHNCRFLQTRPDGTRDDSGGIQDEALEKLRTAVRRGSSTNVLMRNYRKDGTLFYNRLFLTPIRNGAGEVTHFIGVQNDVTEEVVQRRDVERQRHLLQSFFDSAPFLMGIVELCDGDVCHRAANDTATTLFRAHGGAFDAVDGATSADLGFAEAEAERWRQHVQECATTGEPVHFVTRFPWGSEEEGGARVLSVVVNAADEGEPLFSYVAEDVTEQRRSERERRLLAAAVEQAAEPIVVTGGHIDPPGPEIIYANKAHSREFGYELEELIGQSPRLFQGPKTDRAVLDRVRKAMEAGERVAAEAINYRKDGTDFVLQWEIAPVRNEAGEVVNWVGTQRNVTEQRRLEREVSEVAEREQERMARELHDGIAQVLSGSSFKLHAIHSSLAQLGHEDLAAELDRVREHVEDASRQARAVARGLFPAGIDTGGLMTALEQLVVDAQDDYGVASTFSSDGPIEAASNEVAGHLFRITQEALSNAVRHGNAQTLAVAVEHDGPTVVLSVRDDGVGISDRALEGEDGLGLRTMRYRASRVGGHLTVRRLEAGGTEVAVRFTPEAAGSEADAPAS